MIKRNPDLEPEPGHEPGHDNDNGGAVAPAPAAGALASLTARGTTLANVDISGAGGAGLPMMQFKSRENNGTWMYGQRRTIVDDDSRWAFNPTTFQRGYVCFDAANKRIGEKILPVSLPMPDPTELPDHGFKWNEEWSVGMKGITGPDAGVEVVFKTTTVGGIGAVKGLIGEVRDRINGGQHEGKVVPIALLKKDSYQHGEYGKTWFPVLETVDWISLSGPAPAPKPPASPSPPANDEQPRRRRVA
jgi:hypothetical protein